MYFDTHAHYDSEHFGADRHALLASMPEQGVDYIIDPGCDGASSLAALELAERYPFVYAAVGWQPEEWESWTFESEALLRRLAAHPKCVAIGEIGLDYYWDKEHKEQQYEMFVTQLELALELGKPVVIHDREAHEDCLKITGRYPQLRGVFHCFSGSLEMAKELVKRGWHLGFDGPITYKNARKALEVLEWCPLERILVETDSPYLTPVPFRGKRNDSGKLRYIVEKIAQIKGLSPEETAAATSRNARSLFGI
jgi:TatD DNase family protein